MSACRGHGSTCTAVLLFIALLVPPVKHELEASMTAQMLVQIPLLVAVGWLLRDAVSPRLRVIIDEWNHGGITGLVLATLAAACWMLPRSLDAATVEPWMALAKYVSVPLLIGLPFALSWPRMSFIVRGVFVVEFIAMFFRLGWLYMVSPVRLCSNYLLDDQQRLGEYMLVVGCGALLWIAWKLLWGRFDSVTSECREPVPRRAGTRLLHHP